MHYLIIVHVLSDYLSTILEKYPEGSQLKELLQNADDASATEIAFVLDEHNYPQMRLANASLARFQGPAVLAYNDATFKEKDWHSIQTPARSKKLDDLNKTGRFGIGFNSAYHFTGTLCLHFICWLICCNNRRSTEHC